jgi:hypothetical protein
MANVELHTALHHLREGLAPFVGRAMEERYGPDWLAAYEGTLRHSLPRDRSGQPRLDAKALLSIIVTRWNEVFASRLDRAARAWAHELIEYRNRVAHQDDLETALVRRALETTILLLRAVGAEQETGSIAKLMHHGDGRPAIAVAQQAVGPGNSAPPLPPQPRNLFRRAGLKYEPLSRHLRKLDSDLWRASFGEIERILGQSPPSSARRHSVWWSNSPVEGRHSSAWLDLGWQTSDLDIAREQVSFRRTRQSGAA